MRTVRRQVSRPRARAARRPPTPLRACALQGGALGAVQEPVRAGQHRVQVRRAQAGVLERGAPTDMQSAASFSLPRRARRVAPPRPQPDLNADCINFNATQWLDYYLVQSTAIQAAFAGACAAPQLAAQLAARFTCPARPDRRPERGRSQRAGLPNHLSDLPRPARHPRERVRQLHLRRCQVRARRLTLAHLASASCARAEPPSDRGSARRGGGAARAPPTRMETPWRAPCTWGNRRWQQSTRPGPHT